MEPDGDKVLTYKEAMIQSQQPKSLIIIGAGAIGIEFAHFYNTFGTKVTLIEALPNILPSEDIGSCPEIKSKLLIFLKATYAPTGEGASGIVIFNSFNLFNIVNFFS